MGSAGDSPAPVDDSPTGTAETYLVKRPASLARTVAPVPSGESPDGTGGSPVLPGERHGRAPGDALSITLLSRPGLWLKKVTRRMRRISSKKVVALLAGGAGL